MEKSSQPTHLCSTTLDGSSVLRQPSAAAIDRSPASCSICFCQPTCPRSLPCPEKLLLAAACNTSPASIGYADTRRLSQSVHENSGSHHEALCAEHFHLCNFLIRFERSHAFCPSFSETQPQQGTPSTTRPKHSDTSPPPVSAAWEKQAALQITCRAHRSTHKSLPWREMPFPPDHRSSNRLYRLGRASCRERV